LKVGAPFNPYRVFQGSFAPLLDSQRKTVYSIEDEKKAREYAGERVQITGWHPPDQDHNPRTVVNRFCNG
jgi:hypothetical protein